MTTMKLSEGHPTLSDGSQCPLCGESFAASDSVELRNTKPASVQDFEKAERGQPATFEAVLLHTRCLPRRTDRGSHERRGVLLYLEAKSRANNVTHDLEKIDWICDGHETVGGQVREILEEHAKLGIALCALLGVEIASPDAPPSDSDSGS